MGGGTWDEQNPQQGNQGNQPGQQYNGDHDQDAQGGQNGQSDSGNEQGGQSGQAGQDDQGNQDGQGDQGSQDGQGTQPGQDTQPGQGGQGNQGTQPGQPGQGNNNNGSNNYNNNNNSGSNSGNDSGNDDDDEGEMWYPDELDSMFGEFASSWSDATGYGAVYSGVASVDDLKTYGCVCQGLNLNKKPAGRPVDAIDRACFNWRKCNQCNKKQCGGYRIDRDGICTNKSGGCKRRTCECDMALFRSLQNLEMDASQNNAKCFFANPTGPGRGKCCLKNDLNVFYNSGTHDCCSSGDVVEYGQC